jgi:hypothetical protein
MAKKTLQTHSRQQKEVLEKVDEDVRQKDEGLIVDDNLAVIAKRNPLS